MLAFVRALDAEYRDASVRANAILPSIIDTPANREAMPDSDWSKWVAPEQIARVIRFLVFGDSEVTSGAAVPGTAAPDAQPPLRQASSACLRCSAVGICLARSRQASSAFF